MTVKKIACGLAVLAALVTPFAASAEPVYSLAFLPPTVVGPGVIDNQGRIAVNYQDTRIAQAGIWSGGSAITDVGTLGGGIVTVGGISPNGGYVTGYGELGQSQGYVPHAYLYRNGSIADIGTLGGDRSVGLGVNSLGQVTGVSDIASGGQHGFLYANGMMRDLGTLGGNFSEGLGINDAGVVVGRSNLAAGTDSHAFRSCDCGLVDLGTLPGGNRSQANAINDAGVIAGISNGAGFEDSDHVFLYADGSMRDIGSFGGVTFVNDINNLGQVVGRSNGVAFLYTDGRMIELTTLLDTPGWTVDAAFGINDAQQIAAFVSDGQGNFAAVRLGLVSAVPEPQAYALLLAGLALLGVHSRRQARWLPDAC